MAADGSGTLNVVENTTGPILDLDCGESPNPDAGKDICALRDKNLNGFGEDTDKPISYTLSLGDELTSDIDSSQGDKLEVSAVMPGDDGDGSYYIVVSDDEDPSKLDKVYFSGDVGTGQSFTANGIDGKFGSETYVHIFSSDGGSLLQTINFHTSCSAPLVIGDQYGSVSLEGAAVEGKDSGTIYQIGATETDGDAGVVYEITGGADADDFTVDPDTGEVTFLNTPDFENPTDSDGDNKYDVEVTAFFVDANGVKTGEICEVKPLEVCVEDDCINILENTSPVIADLDCGESPNPDAGKDICALRDKNLNGFGEDTDKPISYTLSLGDELTSDIDSSQGDKLEVSAVMPGDDGDGSYYILVSDDEDPSKLDKVYFSGDVGTGQSFTANGIDGKFGSETYVHIFSSDGGSLLQTINFHTSCSAPLVIGDQYGSVSLEGAAVEGKDSGTIYQIGATETDGDAGVVYEITGGADADDFTVDPDTGEVTFLNTPDFENPTDSDGDNKYDVEVTAFFVDANGVKTGEICEVKPLEVCVEDQDCIEIFENTTAPVTDLNVTVDCPVEVPGGNDGLDICAVRDDEIGLGEKTEKPNELTFTLGDGLSNVIKSSQEEGKVEIDTTGVTDNDGSFYIVVSREDDPDKVDKQFFAGDVNFGESFTADTANVGEDFGGETKIFIFDQKDGQLLQKIEFHTSCSQPIVIGDQYGSVKLTGAALEGKDTGTIYTFGGSTTSIETLVEGEIVYSIVGGEDADAFTVDPQTGEVSFKNPPDFEAASLDGDDNYELIVRATAINDPTCFTDTPLEVCVKDVPELGALSGRYFCDDNRDSTENDGQGGFDAGVAGKVVALFTADGTSVADTTTNGNGVYTFEDLEPGDYYVEFEAEPGKEFVAPNVGPDGEDSDVVDPAAGRTETVTVVAGAETQNLDGGVRKIFVKCDDPDAVKVDFEGFAAGDVLTNQVDGLTISAMGGSDDAMVFDSFNPTGGDIDLATAEQGNILIVSEDGDTSDPDDVLGGTLFIEFDNPSKVFDLKVVDTEEGGTITATLADGSTAVFAIPSIPDGAIDQVILDLEDVTKLEIALTGSGAIDDICYVPGEPPLGSLSGRYFCDTNDNDIDDNNGDEPGVGGVLVLLRDPADNSEIARTFTADDGTYSFTDLPPGTYRVVFRDTDGVLAGKQLVDRNDPDGNGDDTNDSDARGDTDRSVINGIEVVAGENTPDNDAGAEKTASLGDKVFLDADRDGVQDAGEAGVAGVTVTLTGGGDDGVIGTPDDTTATATTDGNGEYLFEGLDPGTEYKVTFSDLPAGTEFTTQDAGGDDAADSDADPTNGMTPIVTLAPGEQNRTLDAGLVSQLGALSGRYFCDTNDNDVDDGEATDPGEAGVLVTLIDAAGNAVATTTTGAEGVYRFDDVVPGTYSVRFDDPTGVLEGKQLVDPNVGGDETVDSDAVGDTDTSTIPGIVVNPGEESTDNDAGAEKTASLGDKVFLDADRDGVQDAGEAGVAGVTVTLTGGGDDGVIGTPDDTTATATTDGNGEYLFEGLDPGTEYKVTFSDLPAGTEFTTQDAGGDDAADSDADPTNGMTPIVTLAPGEQNRTLDAGLVSQLGALSGRYFCDTNDNDVDDGEATDPGEAGVLVTLIDAAGNAVATTTTGAEGVYRFDDVVPGTYSVRFDDPTGVLEGKQLVDPNVGGDETVDSDAVGDTDTSTIPGIVVNPGEESTDNDAGAEKTASLGDKVFLDADRDGVQDAGEAGVAGVTVTLTGGGDDGVIGTPDDTTATATTDGNGEYLFEGLDPGTEYKVTFSDLPAGTEFTTQDAGGDDAADSDADPTNGMTPIVTLAPGEQNRTLDAGLVSQLGALSGRYFCDTNDNDVDDGEATDPGEAGVLVTLIDAAGNAVATTTTGAEGVYRFDDVVPGTYSVRFDDPTGVLEGKQLVDPNVGGDETVDSDAVGDTDTSTIPGIVVNPGEESTDNDAGAEKTASLGDKVFLDADRDGVQDAGEAGVAGVTVTLTGGGDDGVIGTPDDTTATATTDGNGEYLFEGLDPGTEYKVTFSDLPAGTEFTTQDAGGDDAADSDADPTNGMTPIVTLAPGEQNRTLDAGLVSQLGALSGRYFCDTNDNDVDDGEATDPGEAGVLVTLIDAAGNAVATTTTGAEGVYRFDDVVPGTYSVRFDDPTGVLEGKQLVDPNVGGDETVDSDAVGDTDTSTIPGIVVNPGEESTDNDAGAEKTASLGDKVFLDADRDGVQDAGEAGVAGVTVTLTGGGDDGVIGTPDDTTATATTDGNGEYLFEGLDPGTEYKVTFSDLPAGTEFTTQDAGGDDAADSDADPTNGMTPIVTLAPGEQNRTLDAGLVSQLGALSGRYFCDVDGDRLDGGLQDKAIEGKEVFLFDLGGDGVVGGGDDTQVDSTFTAADGTYSFTGISTGTYAVQFEGSNNDPLPKGSFANPDDSDADPVTGFTDPITISGNDVTDIDAGIACLQLGQPSDGLLGYQAQFFEPAADFPLLNFNNAGSTRYDAASDTLTIQAQTLDSSIGSTIPTGAQLLIEAEIDETGTLLGGDVFIFDDSNNDKQVTAGEEVFYEGNLLGLGALNGGRTDTFDFVAETVGGSKVDEFLDLIGGEVTSEQAVPGADTGFKGTFDADFDGEAKGVLSSLDFDCIC